MMARSAALAVLCMLLMGQANAQQQQFVYPVAGPGNTDLLVPAPFPTDGNGPFIIDETTVNNFTTSGLIRQCGLE